MPKGRNAEKAEDDDHHPHYQLADQRRAKKFQTFLNWQSMRSEPMSVKVFVITN